MKTNHMDPKIFDSLLEPAFILNQGKDVIYCNEPAALACEVSLRKILRTHPPLDQLFKFTGSVSHLNDLMAIKDPTPYQEMAFETQSGKMGKVQITIQPYGELNSEKTWLVFFRDVTLEETLQKKYRAELEKKENVILDLQKAQAELENYSKNLEKMVAERTLQITRLNQMMSALLDSLHQGFFIFNKEGLCLEISSKSCEATVQTKPPGKMIWDVLKLSETQRPGFQKWMTTLFSEMLPFEDLSPLGPHTFPHSEGLTIQLEYYPLRSSEGTIEGVVVVATDISKLIEAQKEAESERAHAKMILSLIQYRRQVMSFLQDSEALFSELRAEFAKGQNADPDSLFRCLHTLKGGAASFSIKTMSDQSHQAENRLVEWKNSRSAQSFEALRQSSMEIERHFRSFLKDNEKILGSAERMKKRWVELPAEELERFQIRLPSDLQETFIQQFLMEPIGNFFHQYREVVLNVADQEMKVMGSIEFHDSSLRILPEPYSQLFATFIHAYRNAVDHGIETASQRVEMGKPPEGQIHTYFSLLTENQQVWLQIEVKDDGKGVDPDQIRSKLKAKGMDVSSETDEQMIQHLFDSQFSTKEVVTQTSGRGVGMDAIAHAAQSLGGRAWIESSVGIGTSLKVKVPYFLERKWPLPKSKAA